MEEGPTFSAALKEEVAVLTAALSVVRSRGGRAAASEPLSDASGSAALPCSISSCTELNRSNLQTSPHRHQLNAAGYLMTVHWMHMQSQKDKIAGRLTVLTGEGCSSEGDARSGTRPFTALHEALAADTAPPWSMRAPLPTRLPVPPSLPSTPSTTPLDCTPTSHTPECHGQSISCSRVFYYHHAGSKHWASKNGVQSGNDRQASKTMQWDQ